MLETIIIEPEETATTSVIWLHGLGADGNDFVPIVPELNLAPPPHIRFIFPHAPVRPITINGNMPMRAWYDIYSLSRMDQEDNAGIANSAQAVTELIEHEKAAGIDTQQIFLAGFSQGGAMALYTGLNYDQPLAGILALSCYLPNATSVSQTRHKANENTPIFMAHGEQDEILPIALGQMSYQFLKALDHNVQWHTYPMAHQVCAEEIDNLGQWLRKQLNKSTD